MVFPLPLPRRAGRRADERGGAGAVGERVAGDGNGGGCVVGGGRHGWLGVVVWCGERSGGSEEEWDGQTVGVFNCSGFFRFSPLVLHKFWGFSVLVELRGSKVIRGEFRGVRW